MNITDYAFSKAKKLNNIITENDKKEVRTLHLLVKKILMPNFDKLSKYIKVTEIDRSTYTKENRYGDFVKLQLDMEPFIVLKYTYKDKPYTEFNLDDDKRINNLGYFVGINKKGKFVEGKFVKYLTKGEYDPKNHVYKYMKYIMKLRTNVLSNKEFLTIMQLNDFCNIIIKKLGYTGKDINTVIQDEIMKEKKREEALDGILNIIKNIKY